MDREKIFPQGFSYNPPRQGAPDFVIGSVSISVDKFAEWAQSHVNERGYVNIDIKKSRLGKIYSELNTYRPTQKSVDDLPPRDDLNPDDIPF